MLIVCAPSQFGQSASVPFVGCVSYGQTQKLEAPKGTIRSVPINQGDAQALAYYASADGIGLLAPRGWYCKGASGSGGYTLFLSPTPIDWSSGYKELKGPAIEFNHATNDNGSGRGDIAEVMARVFPAYRAAATRLWPGDLPPPTGPYPKDRLIYRSKTIVEYKTPGQNEGLGNHGSLLGKNGVPISGVAILTGEPPDLLLLSIRLPHDLSRLAPVIIRDVEREAATAPRD